VWIEEEVFSVWFSYVSNSLQVRECAEEVSSPRGSPVAATEL
jgi:hypothetical protein